MSNGKKPTPTEVRRDARIQASQISEAVAKAITRIDTHMSNGLLLMREDIGTMAAAIDSYVARDRLLRKIILRSINIKNTTKVPADVRRMLVDAGMILDVKPKEEQHDEGA